MFRSGTLPAALLGLLLVNLLHAPPARAHSSATFYTDKWASSIDVNYGFSTNFPMGNHRARVTTGKNAWNNAAGSTEPDFFGFNPDGNYFFGDPCRSPDGNGVLWFNRPAMTLAEVKLCASASGRIQRFSLAFDPGAGDYGRSWYTGTGDAPSDTYDLWSVAAHEFGHVTGFWGHFGEGGTLCANDNSRHTMCPNIPPGTERQRTLQEHDTHTFDNAY